MSSLSRATLRRTLVHALCLGALVLPAAAWAAGGGAGTGAKPTTSTKHYDYYLTGNAADATPAAPATPMWVLMGGGNDVDSAFQAMIAKARGVSSQGVDVVIIRTSGADGYNPYLMAMTGVDSVESLVIKTRTGADDAWVNERVAKADVLFIAGGDQSTYVNLWKGTKLDTTLKTLRDRKAPFGGTSAGLAVLGDVDYTGASGSITSAEALANPYARTLTLDTGFITGLSGLGGVITDSHLIARDRMGRLVTFLARIFQDKLLTDPTQWPRGIGVDEATAVVVDNKLATVHGASTAYFVLPTMNPTTVAAKKPLNFSTLNVTRLAAGGSLDLSLWVRGSLFGTYNLSAANGVLTSSQFGGAIY